MLGTTLLPVIKKPIRCRRTPIYGYRQNDDTLLSIKERLNKKVGIFKGMSEEDKALLKNKGIL